MRSVLPDSPTEETNPYANHPYEGYPDEGALLFMTGIHGCTKLLSHIVSMAVPNLMTGIGSADPNDVEPLPPLPNEVVHHIFVVGAGSYVELCKKLCLVSSWARLLVLPSLMPIISAKSEAWFLQPESQLERLSSPGNLLTKFLWGSQLNEKWISPTLFTKYLWTSGKHTADDYRAILARCPNLVELALPGKCLPYISQHVEDLLPQVKNLWITTAEYRTVNDIPFLARVTHLTMRIDSSQLQSFNMSRFPSVTHLALHLEGPMHLEQIRILMTLLKKLTSRAKLQWIRLVCSSESWRDSREDGRLLSQLLTRAQYSDPRLDIQNDHSSTFNETGWAHSVRADWKHREPANDEVITIYGSLFGFK